MESASLEIPNSRTSHPSIHTVPILPLLTIRCSSPRSRHPRIQYSHPPLTVLCYTNLTPTPLRHWRNSHFLSLFVLFLFHVNPNQFRDCAWNQRRSYVLRQDHSRSHSKVGVSSLFQRQVRSGVSPPRRSYSSSQLLEGQSPRAGRDSNVEAAGDSSLATSFLAPLKDRKRHLRSV